MQIADQPLVAASVKVTIRPVRMKRITSWAVACSGSADGCGLTLVKSRKIAHSLALAHARAKHAGRVQLEERK